MSTEQAPMTGIPPAIRAVMVLAAGGVAIASIYFVRGMIAPALLAMVVVISVHPLRRKLLSLGWPNWAASCAIVLVSWLILLGILVLMIVGVAQFGQLIQQYGNDVSSVSAALVDAVHNLGLTLPPGAGMDAGSLVALVATLTEAILGLVVSSAFVLVYILFMSFDARLFDGLAERFGRGHALTLAAFARYGSSVRRYYVINTIFGAAVAVCDGLLLWWLGVPGALTWAVLAFVTNYIPSVGFIIGLVPPVLLAFATGGWQTALVVLALYCVINVGLQVFLQPRFVSNAVQLNLTLTFFSVVFWVVILGPVGALLSIPMTLLVRMLVLELNDRETFARWLTGDRQGSC
ncbi:AI-2E family transporter [Leucobacter viscericola]|uniref:AI-2E family transporter n=1 Tax=Leucobacter viscericola TaxID=2714935 RepID=A0A6G7XHU6_9MICO|nr:AI-2E family transporter [Leucobacter viscericola]QIK64180.1 AI-2E family transporter [Leucobacter viscericola]